MSASSNEEMLVIDGDMNIYNAENIKQDLFSLLAKHKDINVNLMNVTEFDTAGFQVLLFGKQYADKNEIRLTLSSASDAVAEVFKLYGMIALLENHHES